MRRALCTHLSVLAASEVAVRRFVLPVRAEAHRPATICTFYKTGENLRCGILLLPSAAGNLLLHLLKHIPADDRLMGIFHPNPFFFRLTNLFLVFIRDIGLLIVYAVANVGFILQNTFDLSNRPRIGFFFRRISIDIGESSIPLIIEPARSRDFFCNQGLGDLRCTCSMKRKVKDFLDDPAGFFVYGQSVFDFGMADVSQRRIGKSAFSGSKFSTERRFHLATGILCEPFVKKVLERHKVRKSFFGVLIFSHSNVANLLFREHKFQIVVHHHVFTAKATEVFGNDAVDLSGLHIIHHPLKAGTLKICSAPSVIDIFAIHRKAMFLCVLLQNGALGLDTHAVAIVFVVTAETHIECGIVRLFHGKNPPSNRNNPRLQYFCFYYTVSVCVVQRHFVVGLSSVAGGILDHIFNQRVHGLS